VFSRGSSRDVFKKHPSLSGWLVGGRGRGDMIVGGLLSVMMVTVIREIVEIIG
jgi:hypothetical protein